MTRKRGIHLKKGETKQKIIEFILSNPTLFVGEPELRDYLKKNHDIREPKNIKRLLNDLAKINLITKQEQRGFENKWGCENIVQIQNIFEEYKDMLAILQKNEKIIAMLNEKHLKQECFYKLDKFWDFYRVVADCKNCKKYQYNSCKSNELDRLKCYDFKFQYIPSYFEDTPVICAYLNELRTSQDLSNYFFMESLIFEPPFFKMHLIKTPEELKEILEVLEQNYEIVSNVVDKHFFQHYSYYYKMNTYWDFYDIFKIFKDTIKSINLFNLNEENRLKCYGSNMEIPPSDYIDTPEIRAYWKKIEFSQQKLNATFKEHLMSSPHFFKMCLKKTPEELKNSFAVVKKEEEALQYLDEIFASCVNTDIINNESNINAINYTIEMKNRLFYMPH